jgi:hypothetical protein
MAAAENWQHKTGRCEDRAGIMGGGGQLEVRLVLMLHRARKMADIGNQVPCASAEGESRTRRPRRPGPLPILQPSVLAALRGYFLSTWSARRKCCIA